MGLKVFLMCLLLGSPFAALANQPVRELDLDRYSGTWHEIARLPLFFQRKCVAEVTAKYTVLRDGNVRVENACKTTYGQRQQSTGVAQPVEGVPGALKVRFAPEWLSWLPMVWGDYWVVGLDPEYRWALVGGPRRDHLWLLSRTPTMPRRQFDAIKSVARDKGYPVDELLMSAPLR